MKKVLCTGGCGFIGSNFLEIMCLKYPEYSFYNIDKLDYCSKDGNFLKNDNYTFIYGNICDSKLIMYVMQKNEIDTVIHFASQTHVDNSFGNSLEFTRDNIVGTHTLLEVCKEYKKIKRFIHISTDEVYGEVDLEHEGCNEKSLLNPTNPYAATKAAAEFICKSYYSSFNIPIIIVRGNNVYGPGQYPEKLIPKFITNLLNNEKCPIHGEGDSRRNFIYVSDVVSAIDTILCKGEINEIYNIGTKNEYSVMDIFVKLCKKIKPTEFPCNLRLLIEDRKFNDFRYSINCDKLKELGWCEKTSFNEGIENTIEWYVKNKEKLPWNKLPSKM